jgi:subtilisin family serine protease
MRSWALDRIEQRELPLDGVIVPRGQGRGVRLYLLDTGVDHEHPALAGQLAALPDGHTGDFVHDTRDASGRSDCNGHGTHLAGILVSRDEGVASAAQLSSLRVADCAGQSTPRALREAIGWLEAHAERPSVVLLSLQYRDAPELGPAVSGLVAAGHVVVAAGGESLEDACALQPSGTAGVLTVLGVDDADVARERSNYGPCVALWAPGSDVPSLAPHARGRVSKSGSSMAAALAAGAAAIYLARHPAARPSEVLAALQAEATPRVRIERPLHAQQTSHHLLFVPARWFAHATSR